MTLDEIEIYGFLGNKFVAGRMPRPAGMDRHSGKRLEVIAINSFLGTCSIDVFVLYTRFFY